MLQFCIGPKISRYTGFLVLHIWTYDLQIELNEWTCSSCSSVSVVFSYMVWVSHSSVYWWSVSVRYYNWSNAILLFQADVVNLVTVWFVDMGPISGCRNSMHQNEGWRWNFEAIPSGRFVCNSASSYQFRNSLPTDFTVKNTVPTNLVIVACVKEHCWRLNCQKFPHLHYYLPDQTTRPFSTSTE